MSPWSCLVYNRCHSIASTAVSGQRSALALLTPADVHYGRAQAMLQARQAVLDRGYAVHPERFVKGAPTVSPLPTAVWINSPPDWSDTSDPVLAAEPMV